MDRNHRQPSYRVALAGRPKLLHFSPAAVIGTPEKQVFVQIFDTLVRLGPELKPEPGLATFQYFPRTQELLFSWSERYFHDGSLVQAKDVVRCIRASAGKFSASIPETVGWFGELLSASGDTEVRIADISERDVRDILQLLALPDFGIFRCQESAGSSPVLGTGPYYIAADDADSLKLTPFRKHPQSSHAIEKLEFVGMPTHKCQEEMDLGNLDEYFYFGSPQYAGFSDGSLRLPSLRANVGILLLNLNGEKFSSIELRRDFAHRYSAAIGNGAFDNTWLPPTSITPPGFPEHGAVNYLLLADCLPRSGPNRSLSGSHIKVGVTNSRQIQRLQRIFADTGFDGCKIEFAEFSGYGALRAALIDDPNAVDCAFLAIRSDRGDPAEFFEFLDASHPTALFPLHDQIVRDAYRRYSWPGSRLKARGTEWLEKVVFDRLLALPIGYYYDVRIISAKAKNVVGLSSYEGAPRYLVMSPGEVLQEVHKTQTALHTFWESYTSQRIHQSLVQAISRTAHDLKSPIAALGVAPRLVEILG